MVGRRFTSWGKRAYFQGLLGGSPFSKWLITMVIVSPQDLGLFPFQMAFPWLINAGDPNYLRTGMILQV